VHASARLGPSLAFALAIAGSLAACSRKDIPANDLPSAGVSNAGSPTTSPSGAPITSAVTSDAAPTPSAPSAAANPLAGAAGGANDENPDEEPVDAKPDGKGGKDAKGGPALGDLPTGPEYDVQENTEHKLGATATMTWVYAGPNDETPKLGYLRAGAIVGRGEKPVASTKRCKGGWYRVAPQGYVCAGKRATIDLNDPVVVDSWKPPARGEPLPYRYGRSKEEPPHLYVKAPTKKEQEKAEGARLAEHLRSNPLASVQKTAGEVLPLPPFLANGAFLPKVFGGNAGLRVGAHEGKASTSNTFAFQSVHEIEGRLFGLSTNLNLIALDRVNVAKDTAIHGGPVSDLPAVLVTSFGAHKYTLDEKGIPHKDGPLDRFSTVSLTGQNKGELWESTEGFWISVAATRLFKKRDEWPSFTKGDKPAKKWVDVSIRDQTLIAYEGTRAVYIARVSTGLGELADPEKSHATKRGVFTIKAKHLTATMTGEEAVDNYELADVPYVQYFEGGYALHAAFWHEDFGRVRSHGCINLTPTDAAWIFEWTDPPVPKDWHGMQANGEGSIVYVHPLAWVSRPPPPTAESLGLLAISVGGRETHA
jgi:lipoprotein-anchoring transpeptidase ErfK/SrfK